MSVYYCDTCDRTIKLTYKRKLLNTNLHRIYSNFIINRYCIKNPEFFQLDIILKKHVSEYFKRFAFFIIISEWNLGFDINIIIRIKSNRKHNIGYFCDIKRFLLAKVDNFERKGYKISHISEMKITFTTHRRNMTFEYCLRQPKSMLEWSLNKKLSINPEPIKVLGNSSRPLIRKYINLFADEGEN